jgi:hypothetical protein
VLRFALDLVDVDADREDAARHVRAAVLERFRRPAARMAPMTSATAERKHSRSRRLEAHEVVGQQVAHQLES